MTFPLIYNLTDLIDKLQDLNILTQLGQLLPQHFWLHLIIHQRQVYITTLLTRLLLATRCLICLIVTGTIDLTLTIWLKTVTFLRMAILFTSMQTSSVAMGSYYNRQVADLILLIREFNFFHNSNTQMTFSFIAAT